MPALLPKGGGGKIPLCKVLLLVNMLFSFGLILSVGFLLLISLTITTIIAVMSDWVMIRVTGFSNISHFRNLKLKRRSAYAYVNDVTFFNIYVTLILLEVTTFII